MIRQYGAQRFRPSLPTIPVTVGRGKRQHTVYRPQPGDFGYTHRVGTIPVGTILYLQDRIDRYQGPVRRNPWQVVAWLNREYYPGVPGERQVTHMTGGHLAVVRSLRDGRVKQIADCHLLSAADMGLERVKICLTHQDGGLHHGE
jgi:hypothetical protein